jgi:hypothetical protein
MTGTVFQAAGIDVHELDPAGERSYVTVATPEPASLAVEVRFTVPLRYAPGSFRTATGGVLSTLKVPEVSVAWLPALSVATTRTA